MTNYTQTKKLPTYKAVYCGMLLFMAIKKACRHWQAFFRQLLTVFRFHLVRTVAQDD